MLVDLDDFKRIDDRWTHHRRRRPTRGGDAHPTSLRTFELAYCVGGEEFLVLLPDADADARRSATPAPAGSEPCHGLPVTISVGVAVTAPGEPFTYRDMFDRADTALDDATHSHRDRVAST